MSPPTRETNRLNPILDAPRIHAALKEICESNLFASAERLKSFLTYVVTETVEGRGEGIFGKTIAQDIYFRKSSSDANRDNVVRVDAGRLRRKLDEYYQTIGAGSAIKIHIDSGGYTPWFENCLPLDQQQTNFRNTPDLRSNKLKMGSVIAAGLTLTITILWVALRSPTITGPNNDNIRELEKQALATRSPATVQAANYCAQARGFLFPVASVDNQKIASNIFRQAIKEAPGFVCGYAGLGHSLATQSLLTPPGDQQNALAFEAAAMAKRAIDLAPRHGWSLSASAWAAFANQDYKRSMEHSALAESIAPTDGNVLDFRGTILILMGDVEEAYRVTHPDRPRNSGSQKFAYRNIHAVASFHLGKYEVALSSV